MAQTDLIFKAQLTGTQQVVQGLTQINLAIGGTISGLNQLGQRSSWAGNILQTAFGYSAGRAIVGTFESIAGAVKGMALNAQDSIAHFQRLGGVLSIAAARERVENSAVKEQVKTRTVMGQLSKQELVQWKALSETWRSTSLAQQQLNLQQGYVKLAQAKTPLARSEAAQSIQQMQGKLANDQAAYNVLVAKQGPQTVNETALRYTTTLPEALGTTRGIQEAYLKRAQDLILHLPVNQDVLANMLTTLTGYSVGRGNKLGIVETSQQMAEGLSKFGIATGKTNDELFSLAVGIGQIQSKGKLMAEEMNRQLANAGITAADVVKAFEMTFPKAGITLDNFQAKMKAGAIKAPEFVEAMRVYLNQFEDAALMMGNTWAYLPQKLQNVKDTIIRIGFTSTFEQLQKPVQALVDLFDSKKHPEALNGIKAIGDSIGQWLQPSMEWLATEGTRAAQSFLSGFRIGGNLWSGIANMLGMGIRTGAWEWNFSTLWDEIVKTKIDTPETMASSREAGRTIGHDIIGGIVDVLAGITGIKIPNAKGSWVGNILGNVFKGTAEGTANFMAESVGMPSDNTWEKSLKQWSSNWDMAKQIAIGVQDSIVKQWSSNWDLLTKIITLTWNNITTTVGQLGIIIGYGFDQGKNYLMTGLDSVTKFVASQLAIIGQSADKVKSTVGKTWTDAVTTISVGLQPVVTFVSSLWNSITGISRSLQEIVSTPLRLWGEFLSPMRNFAAQQLDKIFTPTINALKALPDVARIAFLGLKIAWDSVSPTLISALNNFAGPILKNVQDAIDNTKAIFNLLGQAVTQTTGQVLSLASIIGEFVVTYFRDQFIKELERAQQWFETLKKVMGETASFMQTTLSAALNTIKGGLEGINTILGQVSDAFGKLHPPDWWYIMWGQTPPRPKEMTGTTGGEVGAGGFGGTTTEMPMIFMGGARQRVGGVGPAEAPRRMVYTGPQTTPPQIVPIYPGHGNFVPRSTTNIGLPLDLSQAYAQRTSSTTAVETPATGTIAEADNVLPEVNNQLEQIVSLMGIQAPNAAKIFTDAMSVGANTTNEQMGVAQSIIGQLATTGYPQLSMVAMAWQSAMTQATQAGIQGNQELQQQLTSLVGVLQFMYQLLMGMPMGALGTGLLGGMGAMGLGGGVGIGAGAGGKQTGARQLHFKTSKGRYENPLASGIPVDQLIGYMGQEGFLTAMANYNKQQQAEGGPLATLDEQTSEEMAKSINTSGGEAPKQTEYQRQMLGALNLLPTNIVNGLADALGGGGSGGKGGSKKSGVKVEGAGTAHPTVHAGGMTYVVGKGMAQGTEFVTPGGSSNDVYPFFGMLSGRERVKITPYWKESTGAVMISKAVNIGEVNINSGMDLAVFKTMLNQAMAT